MEKLTIKNRDGLDVAVTVEEGTKGRLAFIAHGLGGFKEQEHLRAFAEAFKEAGYTVVSWDATHSLGESGGDYGDATTTGYYADFEDVIQWAAGQSWYAEPFVLCGHSLGGYCSAMYAEQHPDKVKAIAPISTMVSGQLTHDAERASTPDKLAEWERSGVRVSESKSKPGQMKRLKWSHMEDRLKHDLIPNVGQLTMPVLLVVGEDDQTTPAEHQRLFLDAIPAKQKELHVIKGAGHTPREPQHLAEAKALFSNWLNRIG